MKAFIDRYLAHFFRAALAIGAAQGQGAGGWDRDSSVGGVHSG